MIYQRIGAGLAAVVLAASLGACSSGPAGTADGGGSDGGGQQQVPATPTTAEGVIKAMVKNGADIKLTEVYTAESDPNQRLGRPGHYTSKASFSSPDGDSSAEKGSISAGGGVEVFADAGKAGDRAEYVQTLLQESDGFLGAEYDYIIDGMLLRVGGSLTPTQAGKLAEAFGQSMNTDTPGLYELN